MTAAALWDIDGAHDPLDHGEVTMTMNPCRPPKRLARSSVPTAARVPSLAVQRTVIGPVRLETGARPWC
jgi:hypothetical protein